MYCISHLLDMNYSDFISENVSECTVFVYIKEQRYIYTYYKCNDLRSVILDVSVICIDVLPNVGVIR